MAMELEAEKDWEGVYKSRGIEKGLRGRNSQADIAGNWQQQEETV